MGFSLHPERLKRYRDARLLFTYGRSDLVNRAGLEEALGSAMLFFLAPAGAGRWLAFTILSSDRSAGPKR